MKETIGLREELRRALDIRDMQMGALSREIDNLWLTIRCLIVVVILMFAYLMLR